MVRVACRTVVCRSAVRSVSVQSIKDVENGRINYEKSRWRRLAAHASSFLFNCGRNLYFGHNCRQRKRCVTRWRGGENGEIFLPVSITLIARIIHHPAWKLNATSQVFEKGCKIFLCRWIILCTMASAMIISDKYCHFVTAGKRLKR